MLQNIAAASRVPEQRVEQLGGGHVARGRYHPPPCCGYRAPDRTAKVSTAPTDASSRTPC